MIWIFRIYKWVTFLLILGAFLIFSLPGAVLIRSLPKRQRFHANTVSWFCRLFLKFGRFRIHVVNPPPVDVHELVVANHLGFLDVLIQSAVRPSLFVTSKEMRDTPGLGLLTQMGASIYVDRKDRSNLHNEMLEIRQTLQSGFNVVLFPEATSTNGEQVLPFKRTLIGAAAGTGIALRPAVVNYRKVNGEPVGLKWRDYVCWYGDIGFLEALVRILDMRSVEVEVRFLPTLLVQTEEDRRHVAEKAHKVISEHYIPLGKVEEA